MEDNKLINNPTWLFGAVCVVCIIAVIIIAHVEVSGLQQTPQEGTIKHLESINDTLWVKSRSYKKTIAAKDSIICNLKARNAQLLELLNDRKK